MTIMQNKIPEVPLVNFNTLWFQISGTLCNLQCSHCFISCGPDVSRHRMMSRDTVNGYLKEAKNYGVKEFYLTGGEPFLNPQLFDIVADVLALGDVTILTNATMITTEAALKLKQVSDNSSEKLRFRVSIESPVEEEHDSIRGRGSFIKAVDGIKNLFVAGFNPIITTTGLKEGCDVPEEKFDEWMSALGVVEPQLKILPAIYLGRAEENIRPYRDDERVTENCFTDFPKTNLPCSHCRMITSEGVYVCPILIDNPKARLGGSLRESLTAYAMESHACYTCRTAGLCCSNTTIVTQDDVRLFYGKAAEKPQPSLCCPTIYDRTDTNHIPKEVLDISYGCGSPISLAGIKVGETMIDLGSGGGIDCFIASKSVGPSGRIIGIDMTDEMLGKALKNKAGVVENLGYDNVEFRKGFLEDIPIASGKADLVTSNCVINLSVDKRLVFKEIYRALKDGGRFVISDIVSDRPVPGYMKKNTELWGECISGALTAEDFIKYAKEAGFYGIALLSTNLYKEVNDIRFDSITFCGYKFVKEDRCVHVGQKAVYNGPFSSVSDDDGHT